MYNIIDAEYTDELKKVACAQYLYAEALEKLASIEKEAGRVYGVKGVSRALFPKGVYKMNRYVKGLDFSNMSSMEKLKYQGANLLHKINTNNSLNNMQSTLLKGKDNAKNLLAEKKEVLTNTMRSLGEKGKNFITSKIGPQVDGVKKRLPRKNPTLLNKLIKNHPISTGLTAAAGTLALGTTAGYMGAKAYQGLTSTNYNDQYSYV